MTTAKKSDERHHNYKIIKISNVPVFVKTVGSQVPIKYRGEISMTINKI